MKRFKNISLIYECDQPTLERAAALAKENRAKLTIVYPFKDLPAASNRLTIGGKSIDVGKLVQQEYQARLKEVAKSVRSMGVRPATQLLVGDPSTEVIRDVIAHRRDLVIMTAEGKGGLKHRLFGSLSTHLMRKCPTPLLVLKPSRRKRIQHVLAAVDPEETGGVRDTLNATILELATSLSAREGAQLHVIHAWTFFGESLLRGRSGMHDADLDRVVRRVGEDRRRAVEDLLRHHSVTGQRLHVLKGTPAEVIPRLASSLDTDLLVMGTVCRTGVPGFIIGNTAERVLDVVDCSVLVVKPEGFVSPVAAAIATGDANREQGSARRLLAL